MKKSLRRNFIETLLNYFNSGDKCLGICDAFYWDKPLYGILKKLSEKWEYSVRWRDNTLSTYFIPANKYDLSPSASDYDFNDGPYAYKMQNQPMRREFANFCLREICREMKIKIIQLPEIN